MTSDSFSFIFIHFRLSPQLTQRQATFSPSKCSENQGNDAMKFCDCLYSTGISAPRTEQRTGTAEILYVINKQWNYDRNSWNWLQIFFSSIFRVNLISSSEAAMQAFGFQLRRSKCSEKSKELSQKCFASFGKICSVTFRLVSISPLGSSNTGAALDVSVDCNMTPYFTSERI